MSKLINENCIVFDMEGSKKDIIRILSGELYRAGKITDTEEFYQDVLAREAITPPSWALIWAFPMARRTMRRRYGI